MRERSGARRASGVAAQVTTVSQSPGPLPDRDSRPWFLALFTSLAGAVVAVVWWAEPDSYPFGSGDPTRAGVNHLIERGPGVAMLLGFAALGIALAAVALLTGQARSIRPIAGVGAVVQALFYAFVMSDAGVMSALGYLFALATPVILGLVVLLACRAWRRVRLVLVPLLLVFVAAGFATGTAASFGAALSDYYGSFLEGSYVRVAWSLGMALGAACWAWAAVAPVVRDYRKRVTAPRWGRAVTIGAALCPVPYGLVRLTWLTPWPLGGGGVENFVMSGSLSAAARIQGSFFAAACAVGVTLTLGLISRWGEVFPRWVPMWGGRPVPVKLAVVPGGLVAGVITLSSPMVLQPPIGDGGFADAALMFIAFPLPVWGPLLGAAVFAYWARRRADVVQHAANVARLGLGR